MKKYKEGWNDALLWVLEKIEENPDAKLSRIGYLIEKDLEKKPKEENMKYTIFKKLLNEKKDAFENILNLKFLEVLDYLVEKTRINSIKRFNFSRKVKAKRGKRTPR